MNCCVNSFDLKFNFIILIQYFVYQELDRTEREIEKFQPSFQRATASELLNLKFYRAKKDLLTFFRRLGKEGKTT